MIIRYDPALGDERLRKQTRRYCEPLRAGIDADLPPVRCRAEPEGAAQGLLAYVHSAVLEAYSGRVFLSMRTTRQWGRQAPGLYIHRLTHPWKTGTCGFNGRQTILEIVARSGRFLC
jgi:hypothetical protein